MPGGTLSWVAPDDHAYQLSVDLSGRASIRDCGVFAPGQQSAREFVQAGERGYGKILKGPLTSEQRHLRKLAKTYKPSNLAFREKIEADIARRQRRIEMP